MAIVFAQGVSFWYNFLLEAVESFYCQVSEGFFISF